MQNNKELKRAVPRKSIDLSGISKTDQSFKKACCINNIMRTVKKTGVMPQSQNQGYYSDVSELPDLITSFNAVNAAKDAFYQLPADIRRLMDHDPAQLANFVSNENNLDMCLKYGLLEKKVKPTEQVDLTKENLNEQSGTTNPTN